MAGHGESSQLWRVYFPRIDVEGKEVESAKDSMRDKVAHVLNSFVVGSTFIADVQPEDVLQSGFALYVSWTTLSMGEHAPCGQDLRGDAQPQPDRRPNPPSCGSGGGRPPQQRQGLRAARADSSHATPYALAGATHTAPRALFNHAGLATMAVARAACARCL